MMNLLFKRFYHCRLKHRRISEDTDSSDSSGDTLVMQPNTSKIPEPPSVSDIFTVIMLLTHYSFIFMECIFDNMIIGLFTAFI